MFESLNSEVATHVYIIAAALIIATVYNIMLEFGMHDTYKVTVVFLVNVVVSLSLGIPGPYKYYVYMYIIFD